MQYLRARRQCGAGLWHQAGRQRHIGDGFFIHVHQQVVVAGVRGLVTRWLECHTLDAELDGEGLVDRCAIGGGNDEDLGILGRLLALQGVRSNGENRRSHQQTGNGSTRK
ncbi:hypothetical protein D3C81_2020280 [compost metagenome]